MIGHCLNLLWGPWPVKVFRINGPSTWPTCGVASPGGSRWAGETLAQPQFVSTSVPQGDPCAPAAFTLLLQQGADELREALQGDSCHTQFVDDHNVIVFSPQDLLRTLAHWASWCERLGLKENLIKAKIVPHDPASARELREAGVDPSLLHTEARVLGVDFRQEGGLGATAEKRREQGRASCHVLLVLLVPLSRRRCLHLLGLLL